MVRLLDPLDAVRWHAILATRLKKQSSLPAQGEELGNVRFCELGHPEDFGERAVSYGLFLPRPAVDGLEMLSAEPFMEISLGSAADDIPVRCRHKALVEFDEDNRGAHRFDASLWSCPARSWRFDTASEQVGEHGGAEAKLGANFTWTPASLRATVGPDKKYGVLLGGASQDSSHRGLLCGGAKHYGSEDARSSFKGFEALVVAEGRCIPVLLSQLKGFRLPFLDGGPLRLGSRDGLWLGGESRVTRGRLGRQLSSTRLRCGWMRRRLAFGLGLLGGLGALLSGWRFPRNFRTLGAEDVSEEGMDMVAAQELAEELEEERPEGIESNRLSSSRAPIRARVRSFPDSRPGVWIMIRFRMWPMSAWRSGRGIHEAADSLGLSDRDLALCSSA